MNFIKALLVVEPWEATNLGQSSDHGKGHAAGPHAQQKKVVEKFYPDFLLHSPFKNQTSQSLGTALDQSQILPIFRLPLDCYIQPQDVTNCSGASGRLGLKGLQEGINTRTIIRIRYIARKVQKHLDQVLTLCRICRYCWACCLPPSMSLSTPRTTRVSLIHWRSIQLRNDWWAIKER